MLDAFIIEELRRREERDIGHTDQPRMEMPVDEHRRERAPAKRPEEASDTHPQRGVVVIDL